MFDILTQVEKILANVLPRMTTDGGGAHIVSIEDGIVTLQLNGSCVNCPSRKRSALALKKAIMIHVPEVKDVYVLSVNTKDVDFLTI